MIEASESRRGMSQKTIMISDSTICQRFSSSGYDIVLIEKDHKNGDRCFNNEGVSILISLRSLIYPIPDHNQSFNSYFPIPYHYQG